MSLTFPLVLLGACLVSAAASLTLIMIRSIAEVKANEPAQPVKRSLFETQPHLILGCLLLYGLVVASYFVLRYESLWAESDTGVISRTIEALRGAGAIQPAQGGYQHGFGYQVVSLAILATTQVTNRILQTTIFPYVAAIGLVLVSFTFFTEVTHSRPIAALASLFLLFQPDVLFVTLRGSHEKLTWPLMMVALILLYRSVGQPTQQMALHIGLFYTVVFAMIATNVFFASVFLVSVTLSLALGTAVFFLVQRRRRPLPSTDLRRLVYVCLSGSVLIFMFMGYIYPPALVNLRLLPTIADKVSALLLSFEIGRQPYEYISFGWVSQRVYLGLTAFTWLLVVTSFAEWLRRGKALLEGREELGLVESLDWLLYAGFAIQIAISVIVDFAGVLGANMQLRLFPGFTVMAAAVLARGVGRILSSSQSQGWARRGIRGLSGFVAAWFALASILKATNEPLLSNKWIFYSSSEAAAVRWTDNHVKMASVWSGIDERLVAMFNTNYPMGSKNGNRYSLGSLGADQDYVLASQIERLREDRLKINPPLVFYWNRVYDNGEVQLLYRRPNQ